MRVTVSLFAWLIVSAACHAQSAMNIDLYPNSEMVQRWNSATKKAIAATQPQPTGKKPRKADPLLTNSFQGRTFDGAGGNFDKKLSGQKDFVYDKKTSANKFSTRSFFGLKNPWFGEKVVDTRKASLWSKTEVANADKKFPLESASTKEFYQADKKAHERTAPYPTQSTKVEPKAQGLLSSISDQKNLTVDQVRELLNKQ